MFIFIPAFLTGFAIGVGLGVYIGSEFPEVAKALEEVASHED